MRTAIVTALVLVTGCVTNYWKPGAKYGDLEADKRLCSDAQRSYSSEAKEGDDWSEALGGAFSFVLSGRSYRSGYQTCMASRGWRSN